MKSKILSVLAVMAIFSLTACGTKTEVKPAAENSGNNEVVESTINIPQDNE